MCGDKEIDDKSQVNTKLFGSCCTFLNSPVASKTNK